MSTANRKPTSLQLLLISKLLSVNFQGQQDLREQVKGLKVSSTNDPDNYGSVNLFPVINTKADVIKRIPVEAEWYDSDNVCVHLLLHVVNGLLNELEIYKDNGTAIKGIIDPDKIVISIK
jgi:hypothetical protein